MHKKGDILIEAAKKRAQRVRDSFRSNKNIVLFEAEKHGLINDPLKISYGFKGLTI